jgi:hypothetical protein
VGKKGEDSMTDPLKTFHNMKSRCYHLNDKKYAYYGGKGIKICPQWLKNPVSFATWAENNGWGPGKCIHRKDKKGDYEPNNCEFMIISAHAMLHGMEKSRLPKKIKLVHRENHMKAFLIRNMPEFIHQALKIQAAQKGISLQDLCVKILRRAVDKKQGATK